MSVATGANLANYLSRAANLPGYDNFTIAFWVKLLANTGTEIYWDLCGLCEDTDNGAVVVVDPDRELFEARPPFGGETFSGQILSVNTWYYIVYTHDSLTGQHELMWSTQGALAMSTTGKVNGLASGSPNIFTLGRSTFSEAAPNIRLAECKAWGVPLTPTQALAERDSASAVLTGGLLWHWRLRNNTDTTDQSGNGFHATVNGTLTSSDDHPLEDEEEPSGPEITDVDDDEVITSDQTDVEITGTGFDNAAVFIRQGSIEVEQSVDSQTETSIRFDVVFEPEIGPHLAFGVGDLAVVNEDNQEDTIPIEVDPPDGQFYVDVGTPHANPAERLIFDPDAEAGDQVWIRGVGGGAAPEGLFINPDLTGGFEEGAIAQNFEYRILDRGGDHRWGDWDALTVVVTLEVDKASHGHTAESPTLSQHQTLAVAAASHGHTAESPALTQAHVLTPQDTIHVHSAESPTLMTAFVLVPADALHGHTVDSVALTQAHLLAVNDAVHGHAAESVELSTALNLAVAKALHGHTAESPALTQAHILVADDSFHAHLVDQVNLSLAFSLAVQDAHHGHAAESPAPTVAFALAVADALHAHAADNVQLSEAAILVVSGALHGHLADVVTLRLPSDALYQAVVFVVPYDEQTIIVIPSTTETVNA